MNELKLELLLMMKKLDKSLNAIITDNPDTDPHLIRYPNGQYVVTDLLVAKAHVLVALVEIERMEC